MQKNKKMKKILFLSFTLFIVFLLFANCGSHQANTVKTDFKNKVKAKRMILIALDGISVDGFNTAKHPNLDLIVNEGALSLTTRNVMPSVTLPNWTSHLTGSQPEQHGVTSNEWNKNKPELPPIEVDDKGYYPSIFKVLKDQVPDVKIGFYHNCEVCFWPMNKDYMDEINSEEEYGYEENFKKAYDFIVTNKESPTLIFLYSVHSDHIGHYHGWMSPKYLKSIEEFDVSIGQLMDKLKSQGLYEGTHIMFLTDHGGKGLKHGGISTDEMIVPWSITGPGIKKGYSLETPNNTVNTASTIAYLFDCKPPLSWIGQIPMSIFE